MKCKNCKKEIINNNGYSLKDMQHEDNQEYYFCTLDCIEEYLSGVIRTRFTQ